MFGVKIRGAWVLRDLLSRLTRGKLSLDMTIKHLMEYFGTDEYGHQANLKKADIGYGWIHYGIVRAIKPKRVLCIGSRYGYIPAVLAQACKDSGTGFVDFVDPGYDPKDKNHWTGVGYWKTEKGKECFSNFGLGEWIALYVMTTSEFVKKSKKKYGYIYIDGDHSYKGVSLDYKLLWPRLMDFGFMVFHDVSITDQMPEGIYGVHKLWKKIANKQAFILPFKGSGLGAIQKVPQK